ncbi:MULTISPECIES: type II secretion system protein [Roseateles]|uniref:Type II secretion system protein n=1 Tax=Roseateles albus TaxID=2987525 RepID=A0ABT5KJI7_9BURK|nr:MULTISPECIES: type II secretion system protein [Roseateles]MCV2360974.1 type II secretion system GspH family protein [Paucibacter sp. TC2R-5]MDC8773100.1 type II secretion system protein [Roseateles albus]
MVKSQAGLSMIELMVTIAVMMLLAMAVAPFSVAWGNQAAVRQTQSLLNQAMSQLKSTALRNPSAASATAAAVLISIPGKLCVREGLPGALDCSAFNWSAVPPAAIQLNAAASQCIALDSAGMSLSATVGGVACGTVMSFSISKGSESSNGTLN